MSTALVTPPILMTAEEYARRPDPGHPEELVRGRIVPMSLPNRRHGQICAQSVYLLRRYLEDHDLGHVLCNDAGVITERDPDTVRGADVAFYSYTRLPKGPLPGDYGPEVPELVVEVRSPSDRWPKVHTKVAEYLNAGVTVVVVLDDESRTAVLYFSDRASLTLKPDDELTVPEILPGFAVAVRRFFE
jgi:Uma2 family endonuclease